MSIKVIDETLDFLTLKGKKLTDEEIVSQVLQNRIITADKPNS